ncbi:MAG: ATP-binding protein [Acidobacteria bacterium]|nr:ATP-binding protein [Acidobacteriota bacterium]
MFAFDMHVHTCLSPCGELDMHPAAMVQAAAAAGLDGFVVCDHNAADNVAATGRAARRAGIVALPGMEITTEEEVHLVALLPDVAAAGVLHARVAAALTGPNAPAAFGRQVIVNEDAEVLGFNPSLLAGATNWPVERAVDEIHRAGGLAVAAHIDRERFGLVGQLGFVPPGLLLDAVEISAATPFGEGRRRYADPLGLEAVTGSDAHEPAALGRAVTYLHLDRADALELRRAIKTEDGRAVLGGGRPMEDLALHVLDIAQNGAEAGATRVAIRVDEDPAANRLSIAVQDNGRGMDCAAVARATDPFFTTRRTRSVGLGLALLRQAAEAAGGHVTVDSEPGVGTSVTATFELRHLDRAPLGDVETTVLVLLASHPDLDLEWTHRRGRHDYSLSAADLRAALGGAALASPQGLALVRAAVRQGEAQLAANDRQDSREGSDD